MKQWFKDLWGNILGRPSGRNRYMTCLRGHVTLSRLPDNSRCDYEDGAGVQVCDAVMRPLTKPIWGIFPLSDRVVQLQTKVFMTQRASLQYTEAYQSFCKLNDEQNEMVMFFRAYFPDDLSDGGSRTITSVAIARMKKMLAGKVTEIG